MNIVRIHPSRRCANCAHTDAELDCLQMVSLVGDADKPEDFVCNEHQSRHEWRLDIHRPHTLILEAAP